MKPNRPWYYDPQVLITILFNLYILIEYSIDKSIARSVVLLYWWQSVVIGISHFIQMLTLKEFGAVEMNGEMQKGSGLKYFMSFFFMVHYGLFHIGYLVFLFVFVKYPGNATSQIPGLVVAMITLLAGMLASLPAQISFNRSRVMNIGTMFFSPYLRIVPMHLLIIGGAFIGNKFDGFYIFLILKFMADLVTDWQYRKRWAQWHPAAA